MAIFIFFYGGDNILESKFQSDLKKEIKKEFPECIVTKLDSSCIQGIPDLLILYKNKWATLECKKESNSSHRPNQDYYVDKMNNMSFSRFVNPDNKKEVMKDLKLYFNGE